MYSKKSLKALKISNVKTVKDQTFYKRSTNVQISNRNETKNDRVLSRICLIQRSVFNMRNLGTMQKCFVSFPKRYRIVCPFVFDITTKMLVRVAKRMKKKKDPICETSKLKMVDYLTSVPPKMWSWDWGIFNVIKRREMAIFWPIWSQHIPGPRADSLFT